MTLLKEFQELAKLPKADSKDRATVMMATVEDYRQSHPRLASNERRMLDHIENSCRSRLDLPPLERPFMQTLINLFGR